jgi:hypothetical protein
MIEDKIKLNLIQMIELKVVYIYMFLNFMIFKIFN